MKSNEDDDCVNVASTENYADVIIEDIEFCEKSATIKDDDSDVLIMHEETPRSKTAIMNNVMEESIHSFMSTADPVGTPYYLAPEIWNKKKYSKQSDIWALGVILYELINLKKPFPANDKHELAFKVINNPIEKMRNGVIRPF